MSRDEKDSLWWNDELENKSSGKYEEPDGSYDKSSKCDTNNQDDCDKYFGNCNYNNSNGCNNDDYKYKGCHRCPTGPTGPKGCSGEKGPTGPKGSSGKEGPTGPKGHTGASGKQGIQGIRGIPGIQGLIGPTGLQGIQGMPCTTKI